MTPFLSIVRVTIRQLTGRTRVLGFGVLSLVPAGLLYLAGSTGGLDELERGFATIFAAPFLSIVVPIITLIVASSALGDERSDKTLSFLVLRPVRHFDIVAAKTLAAAVVSACFGVLGAIGLSVSYAAIGGEESVMVAAVFGVALAAFIYSGLFVLLGYAVARPTLVGLLFVVLVDNTLFAVLPRLSPYSPWRVGMAATVDLLPSNFGGIPVAQMLGDLPISAAGSSIRALLIVFVAVVVCTVWMRRADAV